MCGLWLFVIKIFFWSTSKTIVIRIKNNKILGKRHLYWTFIEISLSFELWHLKHDTWQRTRRNQKYHYTRKWWSTLSQASISFLNGQMFEVLWRTKSILTQQNLSSISIKIVLNGAIWIQVETIETKLKFRTIFDWFVATMYGCDVWSSDKLN